MDSSVFRSNRLYAYVEPNYKGSTHSSRAGCFRNQSVGFSVCFVDLFYDIEAGVIPVSQFRRRKEWAKPASQAEHLVSGNLSTID